MERLRDQIREAFPPKPFAESATACPCDECVEIKNALRGKSWDEVSTEFIDFTCSPALFTPEAFQAFLPAYMLRGLDNLTREGVVLDFTAYTLCPNRLLRERSVDESGPSLGDSRISSIRRSPRRGR